MHLRRLSTTALAFPLALILATAAPATAQAPVLELGANRTVSFTGDDLDGLDGGFGLEADLLFPMGPLSFLGFGAGWSDVGFDSDDVSGSLLEFGGLARVGLVQGARARPYLDIRAGYGRLSFDDGVIDTSASGPTAGGALGAMIRAGGMWIDVHGRYQHHWFGEVEVEDTLLFETDASGGRILLGVGVSIPLGG
jgi:hypothetical protein